MKIQFIALFCFLPEVIAFINFLKSSGTMKNTVIDFNLQEIVVH